MGAGSIGRNHHLCNPDFVVRGGIAKGHSGERKKWAPVETRLAQNQQRGSCHSPKGLTSCLYDYREEICCEGNGL